MELVRFVPLGDIGMSLTCREERMAGAGAVEV